MPTELRRQTKVQDVGIFISGINYKLDICCQDFHPMNGVYQFREGPAGYTFKNMHDMHQSEKNVISDHTPTESFMLFPLLRDSE